MTHIPQDMASEAVDLLMPIAQTEGDTISLGPNWTRKIRDLAQRIQTYTDFNRTMTNGESA